MQKYMVTSSTLFIAGQKYKRGDVVELLSSDGFGTNLQPVVEAAKPVEEKPKPARKPRAKKVAAE